MARIYLNDNWTFFEDALNSEGISVRIPHTTKEVPYNYFDEHEYQMECFYRRKIFGDEAWKEKRVFITFEGVGHSAEVYLNGKNIYGDIDVTMLRKHVGMVFQKPNPFPMSIYDNIAYGPRTHGIHSKAKLDEIVEKSLRDAAIWDEVKDRLKKSALGLSGGQQQRLCIARALAVEPEVILMDEPTSALDPISTSKIEDLAIELKKQYTIVMVTHNMQQAVRVSDKTVFFLLGEVIESGETEKLFSVPQDKRTEDYITGRFG